MNADTGQILDKEQIRKMFEIGEGGKPVDWFDIDNMPHQQCPACEGNGFVGYFANSKVIPCVCIFENDTNWARAIVKQRDLGKSQKDKGLNILRQSFNR